MKYHLRLHIIPVILLISCLFTGKHSPLSLEEYIQVSGSRPVFLATAVDISQKNKKTPPIEWLDSLECPVPPLQKDMEYSWDKRFIVRKRTKIDNVRTPCSCTVVDWPENWLSPGDTVSLHIVFTARNENEIAKIIKVYFHSWKYPSLITLRSFIY